MLYIIQEGKSYVLKFPYDPVLIAHIKNVPGRKWNPTEKFWSIPSEHLGWLLNELKGTGYEHDVHIQSEEDLNINASIDSTQNIPDIDITDMDHYVKAGCSLYNHQIDFLKYAKNRATKGFILADEMGCVSGSSMIHIYDKNGIHMEISISELYSRFHKFKYDADFVYKTFSCDDSGNFVLNIIRNVKFSGLKETFKLITNKGKELIATADHEILTSNGYVELQKLHIGDKVCVKDYDWKYELVERIEYNGELYTYDLIMSEPYRNFVANGIVVHNCGKTLEVLNYAMYMRKMYGYRHCLIITCVNSAKYSWQEDIEKHTNGLEQAYILGTRLRKNGKIRYNTTGADKVKDLKTQHMYGDISAPELPYFLITNIESLRTKSGKHFTLVEEILNMIEHNELQMIPIDEVHKNMSPQSQQGKLILEIKKRTGNQVEWIPMTGTPIVNKPTDVYTPLKLVNGHSVKNYYAWCRQFCIFGGYGNYEIMGYKNIPLLKDMLQQNMIRRLKEEVLDLPPKIYYTEYVENTQFQQMLYSEIEDYLWENGDSILESVNPLAKMMRLRQVNGCPELVDDSLADSGGSTPGNNAKLARILELIDEIVERGEKVVVFSNWVEHLKPIYKYVSAKYKTACFTGTMSEQDREKHKRVFINNPNYKVMLGTVGALGVNHTLTIANNVIFESEPWNNATKEQCEDRCHRIGSTIPINIYTLISKDTIDETVHKILMDKGDVSKFIVDGELNLRRNPELFAKLLGRS